MDNLYVVYPTLEECDNSEFLLQSLSDRDLTVIERTINAFLDKRIGLAIPTDENGIIDFDKRFELIIKDERFKLHKGDDGEPTHIEETILKWHLGFEDVGYLAQCFPSFNSERSLENLITNAEKVKEDDVSEGNNTRLFDVTITETSKMTVQVEAESLEEAEQIVCNNWHRAEYIFDADNFVDVDFKGKPAVERSKDFDRDDR